MAAFVVPTLKEIIDRCRADFRVEAGIDVLRRSIESALLRVLAFQSKAQYAYQAYLNDQAFADTADEEHFWRLAALRGLFEKEAAPAQGTVRFTGVDGTEIPNSTQISRSDGAVYTTDVSGSPPAIGDVTTGYVDVPVTAAVAGSAGSNADNTVLTLSSSIPGVDSSATWLTTTVDGSDDETQADGLTRYLQDVQNPESDGGTTGDYVRWALQVAGVTRAWEYAIGANEVAVAFVRDNDGSGSDILPDSGERDAVQAYVQAAAPITVAVSVRTLTALTVNVTLTALAPNTTAVKAAILAELQDLFSNRTEIQPGVGIALSQIDGAISNAAGETSHVMSVPAAAPAPSSTQMPILGTVTLVGDVVYP